MAIDRTHVMGIVGRSGSGKTTLLIKLIPELRARGLSVSTVKHTHHDFDMDHPGKDSYRHREAGACEVLLASNRRWALLHELNGAPEPDLEELLNRMGPVDVILVEGFKAHPYPKIEVHRPSLGHPLMARHDDSVLAVATDDASAIEGLDGLHVEVLDLPRAQGIADFIVGHLNR
ncbi:MAG: molybdopterin-guanine dinucleotide biosynthesis protein B [Rhodospirillales bacterium]|nr:molybdopterin-guanine dinucleotide biosynthesis protein B [Rhodospirillales bacterium]